MFMNHPGVLTRTSDVCSTRVQFWGGAWKDQCH